MGEGGADHSSLFCSLAIAPALLDPRWDLPVAIILTLQMLNLLNLLLGLETKLAMKKKNDFFNGFIFGGYFVYVRLKFICNDHMLFQQKYSRPKERFVEFEPELKARPERIEKML